MVLALSISNYFTINIKSIFIDYNITRRFLQKGFHILNPPLMPGVSLPFWPNRKQQITISNEIKIRRKSGYPALFNFCSLNINSSNLCKPRGNRDTFLSHWNFIPSSNQVIIPIC